VGDDDDEEEEAVEALPSNVPSNVHEEEGDDNSDAEPLPAKVAFNKMKGKD
jgi:hypothetical protein